MFTDITMAVIQDQTSTGQAAAGAASDASPAIAAAAAVTATATAAPVIPTNQTVVVIDDQSTGRLILAEVIRGISRTINTVLFSNPLEAVDYIRSMPVDLVLTDFKMPQMDGIEVIRLLRASFSYEQLPIVMTTIVGDREVRYNAFEAGATDFLIRPVDPIECRARCHNLLNLRQQYLINHNNAQVLEQRVAEVTRELKTREVDTLFRLARAVLNRDVEKGARLRRIARLAALIARGIGLAEEQIDIIELAVGIQDVGSVCIPEALLQKSAILTPDETALLHSYANPRSDVPREAAVNFTRAVASIVVYQHEKFDGTGYPSSLQGEAIPIEARIVALANQVDLLSTTLRESNTVDWPAICSALNAQKGHDLDPALVESLLAQQATAETICIVPSTASGVL